MKRLADRTRNETKSRRPMGRGRDGGGTRRAGGAGSGGAIGEEVEHERGC